MMRRLAGLLLALGLLLAGTPGVAAPPLDSDASREERAMWEQRLRDARAALAAARARHEAAELAYKHMRHRDRARGEARAAILEEREAARRALEEAEARLEALPEAARRAGVPPGWLRIDSEDEPAAPAP